MQGNEAVYNFAPWVCVCAILGGLLGIPAGWFIRKQNAKVGWILLVLGPVLLIIVAPALFRDHVIVDATGFKARYGFWFAPSVQEVRFADLSKINYVAYRDNRNRTKYRIDCIGKSGQVQKIPAGDLIRNAVPEILEKASDAGIPVFDDDL